MGTVYLLHFNTPYRHARHYLGYADNLDGRLWHHSHGSGARLTSVVHDAGIDWTVARKWEDTTRSWERHLKNRHNSPRLCPICNPRWVRWGCCPVPTALGSRNNQEPTTSRIENDGVDEIPF